MAKQQSSKPAPEREPCRACTGDGDGICSYHAQKFRILKKQIVARNKPQRGGNRDHRA